MPTRRPDADRSVRSSPGQQLERVVEDICYRFQRFDGTSRGPWDVEDEAAVDRSRDAAGETPERARGAHGLGQAGGLALDDGAGRLRRDVGRREPRSPSRHDESREPSRQLKESGRDGAHPVGHNAPIDDAKPVLDEDAGQLVTGSVLAGADAGRF